MIIGTISTTGLNKKLIVQQIFSDDNDTLTIVQDKLIEIIKKERLEEFESLRAECYFVIDGKILTKSVVAGFRS